MNEDSEELTTRIIDGLRRAEAPDGMERRILKALRERAASQPATRRPRLTVLGTWGAAAGTTLAACLVLSLALRHRAEPHPALAPGTSPSIAVQAERITPPRPFELPAMPPRRPKTRRARSTVNPYAAAQLSMLSISYPAPPMPLTGQEKLLLRLAHKGDPVQLAMLDPLQRAARNAEERADFQRFFHPPTPPSSPGDTK